MVGAGKEQYLLDTFALLCYLQDEPGADVVSSILRRGTEEKAGIWIVWPSVGEVFYITMRTKGEETARQVLETVKAYPATIVPCGEEETIAAGRIKARHAISLADAYAAGVAKLKGATVVTGDPKFEPVERAGEIRVMWLPRKERKKKRSPSPA